MRFTGRVAKTAAGTLARHAQPTALIMVDGSCRQSRKPCCPSTADHSAGSSSPPAAANASAAARQGAAGGGSATGGGGNTHTARHSGGGVVTLGGLGCGVGLVQIGLRVDLRAAQGKGKGVEGASPPL